MATYFANQGATLHGVDNNMGEVFFGPQGSTRWNQQRIPVWHYGEGFSQKKKLMPVWLAYRNAIRFAIKNDSFVRLIRILLSLVNQGCNPLMTRPFDNPSIKRLRRFSPFINIFLILGACLWNLWNILATVKARSLKYEFRMTSLENI